MSGSDILGMHALTSTVCKHHKLVIGCGYRRKEANKEAVRICSRKCYCRQCTQTVSAGYHCCSGLRMTMSWWKSCRGVGRRAASKGEGGALLKVGRVAAVDLGDLAVDLSALGREVDPNGLLRLAQVARDLGGVPPAGSADQGLALDVQVHLCTAAQEISRVPVVV